MHLMHGETFEQIEVPREAFGELAVWLRDGMSVRVASRQGPTPLPPIRRSTLPSRPCLSIPASPRPQHAITPQHGMASQHASDALAGVPLLFTLPPRAAYEVVETRLGSREGKTDASKPAASLLLLGMACRKHADAAI